MRQPKHRPVKSVIIRHLFYDTDVLDWSVKRVVHDAVTINVVGKHDVLTAVLGDEKRVAVLVFAEAVPFGDRDDQPEFLLSGVVEPLLVKLADTTWRELAAVHKIKPGVNFCCSHCFSPSRFGVVRVPCDVSIISRSVQKVNRFTRKSTVFICKRYMNKKKERFRSLSPQYMSSF